MVLPLYTETFSVYQKCHDVPFAYQTVLQLFQDCIVEWQGLSKTWLTLKSEICIPAPHSGHLLGMYFFGVTRLLGYRLAEPWAMWGKKEAFTTSFTMNPVFILPLVTENKAHFTKMFWCQGPQ